MATDRHSLQVIIALILSALSDGRALNLVFTLLCICYYRQKRADAESSICVLPANAHLAHVESNKLALVQRERPARSRDFVYNLSDQFVCNVHNERTEGRRAQS